jgi:uncharacterized protein
MHQYPNLYHHKAGDNHILFNPLHVGKVVVLNKDGYELLNELNKFSLQELVDQGYKKSEIEKAILVFRREYIVYKNQPVEVNFPKSEKLDIWLQTTNQCNLRCPYCYVKKNNQQMSLAKGKQIVNYLFSSAEKNNYKTIVLKFAGGEPTLCYDFVKQISVFASEMARKKEIEFKPVLVTNGTLINKKWCNLLKHYNFHVGVSVDGWGEVNDRTRIDLRGKGSFKRIKRSLKLLKQYQVRFNLEAVITRHNYEDIYSLAKRAYEKYNNILYLNLLRTSEMDVDAKEQLVNDLAPIIDSIKKIIDFYDQENVEEPIYGGILALMKFEKPRRTFCAAGDTFAAIGPDGYVSACHMLLQKTNLFRIGSGDFITNLKSKAKGLAYQGSVDQKEQCRACKWRYICSGGCPREVKSAIDKSSPYCDLYKEIIPELINLEGRRLIRENLVND